MNFILHCDFSRRTLLSKIVWHIVGFRVDLPVAVSKFSPWWQQWWWWWWWWWWWRRGINRHLQYSQGSICLKGASGGMAVWTFNWFDLIDFYMTGYWFYWLFGHDVQIAKMKNSMQWWISRKDFTKRKEFIDTSIFFSHSDWCLKNQIMTYHRKFIPFFS